MTAPPVLTSSGPERAGTASAPPVPMSALRRGDEGRVTGLDPALSAAVRRRLLDLGFECDATVRCLRRAPLGSPTVYRIGETDLCLRGDLAGRVLVEPSP